MIITLSKNTNNQDIELLINKITENKMLYKQFTNYIDGQQVNKILVLPNFINSENKNLSIDSLKHNIEYQSFVEYSYKLESIINRSDINNSYPIISREQNDNNNYGFEYMGINFSQESFTIFAGLNAVDTKANVNTCFKKLNSLNLQCARMGAYKPRTNPYSFQGLGDGCLEYVFESARQYNIKVIAMEVTAKEHIEEITKTLDKLNQPCGVMLQIGTRNIQNFELLKAVGSQTRFPVLLKRGFGISLEESLCAAEYIAHSGNNKIIFCLRGMKSNFAYPHRNFVDFSMVPTIKRLTKLPVCIDPSHAVGSKEADQNNIFDLLHANASGIISGANMSLIDIHPTPNMSPVDNKQILTLEEFDLLFKDSTLSRDTYIERKKLFCN